MAWGGPYDSLEGKTLMLVSTSDTSVSSRWSSSIDWRLRNDWVSLNKRGIRWPVISLFTWWIKIRLIWRKYRNRPISGERSSKHSIMIKNNANTTPRRICNGWLNPSKHCALFSDRITCNYPIEGSVIDLFLSCLFQWCWRKVDAGSGSTASDRISRLYETLGRIMHARNREVRWWYRVDQRRTFEKSRSTIEEVDRHDGTFVGSTPFDEHWRYQWTASLERLLRRKRIVSFIDRRDRLV